MRVIIEVAHKTASDLIEANRENLELMAEALMKYETINSDQIDQIMEGKEPDPPEDWTDSEDTPSAGSSDAQEEAGDDTSPIGGPASQH